MRRVDGIVVFHGFGAGPSVECIALDIFSLSNMTMVLLLVVYSILK